MRKRVREQIRNEEIKKGHIYNIPDYKMENIKKILKSYWGYDELFPMQKETIFAILNGYDTLTVLPTGGGKSLCFQLPAMIKEGVAIVVSPTKSLMKDQVDSLKDIGVQAAYWNSSLSRSEVDKVIDQVKSKITRLLYITPERLCHESMIPFLKSIKISFFVIDEAHCISQWGHSFRDDYRKLRIIKDRFSEISTHAFTASATVEVQQDIIEQLKLNDAKKYIGSVDRPNLTYRIMSRNGILKQTEQILDQHNNEPGIIYCMKRKDVDSLSDHLNEHGYKNLPYHAGLTDEVRTKNQNLFASEQIDIMVATIAFGMGIDRSNIRFVIHEGMPKNMEQYSQETGRAGRDGLPAYCYLFFGAEDYRTALYFIKDAANGDIMKNKLDKMYGICLRPQCRHRVLSNYFGQKYDKDGCNTCDYCLGEVELVQNPKILGQKIVSIIKQCADCGVYFGSGHIGDVLQGKLSDKVTKFKHDKLSDFGCFSEESSPYLRYMIEQLIGQGYLTRNIEYSTIKPSEKGLSLFNGEGDIILAKPLVATKKKSSFKKQKAKYEGDYSENDKNLFQVLRAKRTELARIKKMPAYIICSDKTLWDMIDKKPSTFEEFLSVFGIGKEKQQEYANAFIAVIKGYVEESELSLK